MIGKLFLIACLALTLVHGELEDEAVFSDRCPPTHFHHLLPHEYDCTKFYYCEYGMKWVTPRDCAPGTEFSYRLQVCVHPRLADCNLPGSSTTSTTTTTTTTTRPTTTTTRPTTTTTTTSPTTTTRTSTPVDVLDNGCPADFDIHHLLPHETYCNKFYYCVFGEKVLRKCPRGTQFNPDLQVCDWPWNVDCDNDGDTSGENENWLDNDCPADFSIHHLLPHENCNKFYYCVFGEKVQRECPSGLHFNPMKQVCDWPWRAGCEGDDGEDEDIGTDNKCDECNVLPWAHATDCDKFWMCNGDQKVSVTCSLGLHFNPDKKSCDFICNAGCSADLRMCG